MALLALTLTGGASSAQLSGKPSGAEFTSPGVNTSKPLKGSLEYQFRRCACRALAGDFGKLQAWQRQGYKRGLNGAWSARVWLTQFYPSEGFPEGAICRWSHLGTKLEGREVRASLRVAASNTLKPLSWVWIADPCHIRQVWDTGAKSNDARARRQGAKWWVDLWVPHKGWKGLDDSQVREVVCIDRADNRRH